LLNRLASSAVFEILGSKRIVITSLTFQGHVTSSVMCVTDSPNFLLVVVFGTDSFYLQRFPRYSMRNVTQWSFILVQIDSSLRLPRLSIPVLTFALWRTV